MQTTIIGYGTIGSAAGKLLLARGETIRICQRSAPARLPDGASFTPCDVLDLASLKRAAAGSQRIVLSLAFPYDSRVWRRSWPRAMRNVVAALDGTGIPVVFLDNLYQLGAQTGPRREDMPLTNRGRKPAILSAATRIWRKAADAGRIRMTALRCPDFYGPGVAASHLGPSALGRLAKGQPALLMIPPDVPHDFAYVPDIARAMVTLLDAKDGVDGEVWNMPCAPTMTPREILALGAEALGAAPRITAIPFWALAPMGLFWRFASEVRDVGFTWTKPFQVDASKFKQRFWSDVTPYDVGAAATAQSFKT
ncbi:MAG TPA: NAD-dependent epimerase/dehydratase family protein [Rhizomicrobium sp.]|jgi:nucleoside-diphosphate-sugar epimerase|nr:NAD-dependent epimerase/dehydratase family protein [Rhizomicrobium sp.]